MLLLRSEIPNGLCAKLRTLAASNNRVHMPWLLYYCLFAPQICMVLFFTHIPFVVNHAFNETPPERLQHNHYLTDTKILLTSITKRKEFVSCRPLFHLPWSQYSVCSWLGTIWLRYLRLFTWSWRLETILITLSTVWKFSVWNLIYNPKITACRVIA